MGGRRLEGQRQRSGERPTEGLKESAGEEDGRKRAGEGETCSKTVVLPDFVDLFISNVFPLGGGGVVGFVHIRNERVLNYYWRGEGNIWRGGADEM